MRNIIWLTIYRLKKADTNNGSLWNAKFGNFSICDGSGKPIYGVKTSSGVTAACLPAYYEAYDAYTHRYNELD